MQQRRLRLGDILDDYCPRERRITNHTVVAMVEDEVKQTRCTACEADHEYRNARVPPPRRKRPATPVADQPQPELAPRLAENEGVIEHDSSGDLGVSPDPAPPSSDLDEQQPTGEPARAAASWPEDEGPVHRRLIRATLPRPEGQAPERRGPDFTVRQQGGRGGREADGNRAQPGGHGRRPGHSQGYGHPQRFGSGRSPRQGDGSGHNRPGGNREGRPGQGGNRPPGSGRRRRRGR